MSTLKKTAAPVRPYTLWKIASILVVGILTVATIVTFYCIYHKVFDTIENQGEIARLNAEPNITAIDSPGLLKAEAAIALKNATPTPFTSLRNIFVYTSSSPILYDPTPNPTSSTP